MRCNRRLLYVKVKSFFLLTTILSTLVVLITFLNHRPSSLLRNVPYTFGEYGPGGYRYREQRAGEFLADYKQLTNGSYCNFKYNLPDALRYEEHDLAYSPERTSAYRVLYNVLEGRRPENTNNNASTLSLTTPSVTYATHVTPEFINYISEIVRRWEGAVSVAAFVPDDDADLFTRQLLHICQCLPDMWKVSVHYVFPNAHRPYIKRSPQIVRTTCTINDVSTSITYRTSKQLAYPVNVARNVARHASTTDFILVSDVELMPSERLATHFARMMRLLAASRRNLQAPTNPSRVFVVPVFEVEKYERIPRTKRELVRLVKQEKALYFHRHICSHCQKFPGLENWMQLDGGERDYVKPLLAVKREYPYHRWEPIYIGGKDEPLYSEALSWEGKQDKMTQMLEMCLKGYRFIILDNAFLIHWPGVKRKSMEIKLRNKWRYPFLLKNTRQYNIIINNLASRYKKNPKCKIQ